MQLIAEGLANSIAINELSCVCLFFQDNFLRCKSQDTLPFREERGVSPLSSPPAVRRKVVKFDTRGLVPGAMSRGTSAGAASSRAGGGGRGKRTSPECEGVQMEDMLRRLQMLEELEHAKKLGILVRKCDLMYMTCS